MSKSDDNAVKAAANKLYKGDITEVMVILAMATEQMATWVLESNKLMAKLSIETTLNAEQKKILETTRDVAKVAKAWAEGDEDFHEAHKATDAKPEVLH